ncbi:MAG TPA: SPFH domain-containing protein, partial [Gemmatimonadales bacterium]|nr:SPFH domain-containing protein [Gemmatimonadales bacterium]
MIREKVIRPLPGLPMVLLALGILGINTWLLVNAAQVPTPRSIVLGLAIYVLTAIALGGFLVVQPNEAKVLTLFGKYSGTVKEAGFWWVNPFTRKTRLSLRTRNFETAKLKVNDAHG